MVESDMRISQIIWGLKCTILEISYSSVVALQNLICLKAFSVGQTYPVFMGIRQIVLDYMAELFLCCNMLCFIFCAFNTLHYFTMLLGTYNVVVIPLVLHDIKCFIKC
jgi:hypothetical protein